MATITVNKDDIEYQKRRLIVQQRQALYALANAVLWLDHLAVKTAFTGVPMDKILSGEVSLKAVTIRLIQEKD